MEQHEDVRPYETLQARLAHWDAWQGMSAPERLGIILQVYTSPAQWLEEETLATLATFRHHPVRWAQIKARYKEIGGNPWDFEKAATVLNPRPLADVPIGRTWVGLQESMPELADRMRRPLATSDEQHEAADVKDLAFVLQNHWEDQEALALIQSLHLDAQHQPPGEETLHLLLGKAYLLLEETAQASSEKHVDGLSLPARSRLMKSLADFFKIPLARVIRHGKENALWTFVTHDGTEIHIGTSSDLHIQQKVRVAIFDHTGIEMTRLSAKEVAKWDSILEMIARVAEMVDTPEFTGIGRIKGLLLAYVDMENVDLSREATQEEWPILLDTRKPYRLNGMLHISTQRLCGDIMKAYDPEMTNRMVIDLLRRIGAKQVTITVRGNLRFFRRVWLVDCAWLDENTSTITYDMDNDTLKPSFDDKTDAL